ncbi:hypothetical protein [Pantoea sp. aB]|uniref:hypothetical protein n=1 Tax=Pantoea sp. aB TaxID=517433 RepID=UPI0001E09BA6|nr:hypothetical protein [Pantoea sp. aB]EFM18627.1 hypothetical protein PanABDRAFT_3523 [Pantoea sp. aB]
MTVSTVINHEQYTGNGVTTAFPFRFRILKSSHMVVTVSDTDGNLTTLINGSDYTVKGVGLVEGGTVNLSSPLMDGWKISLDRDLPATQETDLRNQGKFFAETHEDVFDYLTMLVQKCLGLFGLALRRPSWLAKYYDAEGNRISNMGDPVYPQDGVTKSWVESLYIDESASATVLKNQLASTLPGQGDAMLAVKPPYTGSATRTQHNVNAQYSSILDFLGDSYSGTTDAASAFASANTLVPKGRQILVPAGTYLLNSEVDCYGRHFIFEEPVTISGPGYLRRAVIHRYDGSTGSLSVASTGVRGSDNYPQFGTVFRFGGNAGNVTGFQFGGADPIHGAEGVVPFMDGYSSWLSLQPSKFPSPIELAVQPGSLFGKCQTVTGTNQVNVITGAGLTSNEIGKTIWLKDAGYTVTGVGTNSFTVMNLNGSAVSFPSAAFMTYLCSYIWGRGKCNVNGTAITRISGDPFVPLNNIITTFVVNGVTTTQAGYTDSWKATLTASAGTASNVDYYWWGSVDNLTAAIRVHRGAGGGFEENFSILAKASGNYHLHAASGSTDQYPIYIGSGYDADGTARRQITIDGANGVTTIGGGYGRAAAEFGYRNFATGDVNRFRFDAGLSGNPAVLSASGPDANINTVISAKGTGFVQFNSVMRPNAAILFNIDNAYTVGASGARPSQVWAANGTIQTSDGTLKTAVTDSDLGLDFINGLRPVSYKFISGGNVAEEVDDGFEEIETQVMEITNQTEQVQEQKEIDGELKLVRSYVTKQVERPVFDSIDVVDESGNYLETVSVPRMQTVKVPKKKQVIRSVPGERIHYGLIAQEVKALMEKMGVEDFGGYVKGEDGVLGLRYEQFISPVIKSLQQISERLEKLESK